MPFNFEDFDPKASREEKLRVLEQNDKTLKALERAIQNPQMGVIVKTPSVDATKPKVVASEAKKEPKPLDTDFIAFFSRLSSLNVDADFTDNVYKLLDPSDYRFNNFMAMSKLKIYENIVMLSNMAFEDHTMDMDETIAYIHELQALLVAIDEVMEEKALIEESSSQLNDLFFLFIDDKIPLVESIDKEIVPEYYDRIIAILEDLRRGYLRNFKYLGEKKFFEIRSDLVRVFFARIGPNKFLILDAILKKKKSSTEYWDRMYDLRDVLAKVKPYYSELANNEEEKQRHLEYYLDILQMLNSKKRGG